MLQLWYCETCRIEVPPNCQTTPTRSGRLPCWFSITWR